MRVSATRLQQRSQPDFQLSYPLIWGCLQPTQNQHIGESDLLLGLFQSLEIQSAYDIELETSQIYGKIISIMTIFHVFPHFNSPQPNLNLRKWIKDIQWNTHSRKMFKHPHWISDNYKSVYMISSQLFSHNQDNMSFATVIDTLRYW